jgi:putative ABC transport system permease protein
MSLLFWMRYSLRSLHRSGRRALFALVCIAVGVASVVALQTASLTVQNALLSNVRAANGGDISVSAEESPISKSDLGIFRQLQRQGQISTWTAVYTMHATAVGPAHQLVPFDVQVVSVPPYPLGGQPTFVSPSNGAVGTLIRKPGDVLITSVLADELGAHIGDRLVVNSVGGKGLSITIRGILAETSFQHAAVMTVDQRDAAVLTQSSPHYMSVYVNVTGSAAAVATVLRQHFPVATVQTVQEALQATEQEVHDFRQFMLLVGLLALLVAGIGILNAMQSMLAWRRLEIAMLKAVGFPRISLFGLFGAEALLLGIAGGVAGSVLGAASSKVITEALARALAVQVTFVLDLGTLFAGVVLGAAATLVFAVLPIVRAASFRPLEILREGAAVVTPRGLPQTLALIVLVVLLFAALSAAIMGDLTLATEFIAGAFGAFVAVTGIFALLVSWIGRLGPPRSRALALLGLACLAVLTVLSVHRIPSVSPLLALATLVWAATLLPARRLLPLLIAVRTLSRRRARTSVTLTAFLVGVLAMSVTLTVALSLHSQITDALASNGMANLVAVANPSSEGAVAREARKLQGVKDKTTVTVVQTTPTAVNGQPIGSLVGPSPAFGESDPGDISYLLEGVTGINLRTGAQPTQITLTSGRALAPTDSGTANVLVRDRLQDSPWNLVTGSTITLHETGSGNSRTVRVVGFYHRARRRGFGSFFTGPIFGDRSLAVGLGGADAQSVISFTIASDNLTHDASTLQQSVPGILVLDIGDLTRVIDTILGELLNLLAVITALALGAALAVVGNGVALAMLERRREIALFKAIGFSPGSVLQFVLVENALAGTLAGAVSVLGVVAALAVLSKAALDQAIGFDPVVATLILVIAAALAVVTSYLAARTPINVRPIEVLRNE